ncbi:hypothetical protein DPEC_G00207390 [Dallia pectoralis]|uniref:Uncharacterized protein n=1 Tax=Dallia pectoralis TaxID=75939 RepID=A0ACC2G556_DALPE|nr:hypothetical protein DPEC_G00207390 [Dallia pectoralis]
MDRERPESWEVNTKLKLHQMELVQSEGLSGFTTFLDESSSIQPLNGLKESLCSSLSSLDLMSIASCEQIVSSVEFIGCARDISVDKAIENIIRDLTFLPASRMQSASWVRLLTKTRSFAQDDLTSNQKSPKQKGFFHRAWRAVKSDLWLLET